MTHREVNWEMSYRESCEPKPAATWISAGRVPECAVNWHHWRTSECVEVSPPTPSTRHNSVLGPPCTISHRTQLCPRSTLYTQHRTQLCSRSTLYTQHRFHYAVTRVKDVTGKFQGFKLASLKWLKWLGKIARLTSGRQARLCRSNGICEQTWHDTTNGLWHIADLSQTETLKSPTRRLARVLSRTCRGRHGEVGAMEFRLHWISLSSSRTNLKTCPFRQVYLR